MESEIEENYKKNQFLYTIKTGKIPSRSGLGERLYQLGGYANEANRIYCTMEKCEPPLHIEHPDKLSFTKRLSYNKYTYKLNNVQERIRSSEMKSVFEKYLKYYAITDSWGFVFVYFDPKNMPCWGILDNDLKIMYPNNHRVDKRGFVYYKRK